MKRPDLNEENRDILRARLIAGKYDDLIIGALEEMLDHEPSDVSFRISHGYYQAAMSQMRRDHDIPGQVLDTYADLYKRVIDYKSQEELKRELRPPETYPHEPYNT